MAVGPVARPLPRILQDPDGTLYMPAYSWLKAAKLALWLKSTDRGRNWHVASVIAHSDAMRTVGAPVTTPWLENMVARTCLFRV